MEGVEGVSPWPVVYLEFRAQGVQAHWMAAGAFTHPISGLM